MVFESFGIMVYIKIPGYFHLIPRLDMFLDHVFLMCISVAPLNEVCTLVNHDFCGSSDVLHADD